MHDISVSALAAAVLSLGVVIMLELRSVLKLRQVVDGNLARVFEQLDLLRFESQQLLEGQQLIEARVPHRAMTPEGRAVTVQAPPQALQVPPVAAPAATAPATVGEARLLSSLAQARARRAASGPLRT
jgi:uncharacterized protein YoxC